MKFRTKNPIFWSFVICFIYWTYLFFTTHIQISCDAIAYEQTSRLLQGKGWAEFFKTGPQREPFYPFLISLAMHIGNYLSVSYKPCIILLQLSVLFITQILMLRMSRILNINTFITAGAILYAGISPAIVNSALSLFSEIAVYPFVISIPLISYSCWLACRTSTIRTALLSALGGLIFFFAAMNKAIFTMITPVFLILFFVSALPTRNRNFIRNAFLSIIISFSIFYTGIVAYKTANKTYNGNFVITNRGDMKFYGTAVRRTQLLTPEQLLTALACIPGDSFGRTIFSAEKCYFWRFEEIDNIGCEILAKLDAQGLSYEEASKRTIQLAIEHILKNPAQYCLLFMVETIKMFFWESTRIGFVEYPQQLETIFTWTPFKNGIRLVMSLFTILALIYQAFFLYKRKGDIFIIPPASAGNQFMFMFLCAILISVFIGTHALVNTVPRYALPLSPLYLISIAFFLQRAIEKKTLL